MRQEQIYKDRMQVWQDHLRTPEVAEKWRMESYAWFIGSREPTGCGTAACALGHATTPFKQLTLRWRQMTIDHYRWFADVRYVDDENEIHENLKAANEFFGLTGAEAVYICIPTSYGDQFNISPSDAAEHVRQVLSGEYVDPYSGDDSEDDDA